MLGGRWPCVSMAFQLKHTIVVDASYEGDRGVVGIGVVVHATDRPGRNGPIIETTSEAYVGVTPALMEKFAVLRALEIAAEKGYRRLKIRSDYNSMRRGLKEDAAKVLDHMEEGLHRRVLELASTLDEVKFSYVPRRKNQTAHALARQAAKAGRVARWDIQK